MRFCVVSACLFLNHPQEILMTKTTFGGGGISPSVAAHLAKRPAQKPAKCAEKLDPSKTMGGGGISPSVKRHLAKR